jgi:hypothetical protein
MAYDRGKVIEQGVILEVLEQDFGVRIEATVLAK